MTITIPDWWLVPAIGTFALFALGAIVARKLAGGDDSGTGILMFPASLVAAILSAILWTAYFLCPLPFP